MNEDNVKNIQKFLIAQLSFTPRRKMFEDQLIKKEAEKLNKFQDWDKEEEVGEENYDEGEIAEESQWKLIKRLRAFRKTHITECVHPVNRQKYVRAEKRNEEFMCSSDHTTGPPTTEELIKLIERDKKKESIKTLFNAYKF